MERAAHRRRIRRRLASPAADRPRPAGLPIVADQKRRLPPHRHRIIDMRRPVAVAVALLTLSLSAGVAQAGQPMPFRAWQLERRAGPRSGRTKGSGATEYR